MGGQISKEFFQQVLDWWNDEPTIRNFEIKPPAIQVWFYDYNLMFGEFAENHIPDLAQLKIDAEMEEYEKIKNKFERRTSI